VGVGAGWVWAKGEARHSGKIGDYHLPLGPPSDPIFPAKILAATAIAPRTAEAAQQKASRVSEIMRYGFPSLANIRALDDYVLAFDPRTRVPAWVFEHLTKDSIAKTDAVDRAKCSFVEDDSVHQYFRSSNKDYKGSGFDRGHMAAAGNHRLSQDHCQQTFLLSNIAPQVGKGFNRDKWNSLEQYCRWLARHNPNVYVCTGPLYLPRQMADGHLWVSYRVLGDNHVAVPTHFFKVVVTETAKGELCLESFVLPNAAIEDSVKLNTFHVPLEVVERASGLLFFDQLNKTRFAHVNPKNNDWV